MKGKMKGWETIWTTISIRKRMVFTKRKRRI
jgi:hypothetical protein